MNFELSEEQTLLAETIKRFVATHYNFDARAKIMASPSGHSEDVWAAIAEMGLLGLPFDEAHGGFGGTTVDVMLVMEAIGEGLLVEPYLATVGLGGRFVARAGTKAQRDRILPALIQGKHTLALAHTEPGARYDLRQVGLRARRSGDGWVLDGDKRMVLHGGNADTLVVSARTAGGNTDAAGITLFLVPRATGGVAVKESRTIDNLRAADIRFSGVSVGADALLGREGEGYAVVEEVVDYATALLCAEAVGASSNNGDRRQTMNTPAVTIVAAWIRAETGVGPSMASGSQTWSGICALLPVAPTNRSRHTMVAMPNWPSGSRAREEAFSARSTRSTVPKAWKATIMPRISPTSPIRFTTNAFMPARAALGLRYQNPISR